MPVRKANAVWQGGLKKGNGKVRVESGAFELPYSFSSRFEEGTGTNPEELIGAAHAGCFAMALSMMLEEAGFPPEKLEVSADVHIDPKDGGFAITRIDLSLVGTVPNIDEATFQEKAQAAKQGCPVSQALSATRIELAAELKK